MPETLPRVALLTQHGKERVLAPMLEPVLGCRVELVTGFDTDRFGTFTREIPRAGTQLEAARRKARTGMELAGLQQGLASEGAFGPDPYTGMFPWNVEVLVYIDDAQGLELLGLAEGRSNHLHRRVRNWSEVEAFAHAAGFPEQHLVVRPEHENDPRAVKGIADWTMLDVAFAQARAASLSEVVFLETDLRAHANPARMEMIRQAAENLVARYQSSCPACGAPGFWTVERVSGLPCADCGAPTREARADVWGCIRCAHRETYERQGVTHADPGRCDWCNP